MEAICNRLFIHHFTNSVEKRGKIEINAIVCTCSLCFFLLLRTKQKEERMGKKQQQQQQQWRQQKPIDSLIFLLLFCFHARVFHVNVCITYTKTHSNIYTYMYISTAIIFSMHSMLSTDELKCHRTYSGNFSTFSFEFFPFFPLYCHSLSLFRSVSLSIASFCFFFAYTLRVCVCNWCFSFFLPLWVFFPLFTIYKQQMSMFSTKRRRPLWWNCES